jgi:hypothetical protein
MAARLRTGVVVIASKHQVRGLSICRAKISLSFGLAGCLISWAIVGEKSPLRLYFLYHVAIPNLWARLHTIPYIVIVVLRPTMFADAILYFFIFIQWAIIGFLLALLVCKRQWGERQSGPPVLDQTNN